MTGIRFETCDRRRALEFLRKFYPSAEVEDTEESAGPVLDMVERDVFRIPDPDVHGYRATVYPSANWGTVAEGEPLRVLSEFHARCSVP
jgi:hypothetical protein